MKKIIGIFLVLTMCLSLCACGGTGNADHDYILKLLEQEDYDMAIYVIEGLRDGRAAGSAEAGTTGEGRQEAEGPQKDQAAPGSEARHQLYDQPPESNGTDWIFHMFLENMLDEEISLEALIIVDYLDGSETGRTEFVEGDLERIGLGGLVLQPHDIFDWHDAHPAVDFFDQRLYQFIFRDGAGEQVDISYYFHMEDMLPQEGGAPAQEQPTGDWYFPIVLENTGDTDWSLYAMDITDLKDGEPLGTSIFEGEDSLSRIGLWGFVMSSGQVSNWNDAHPATLAWNGREYRFHFKDERGEKHTLTFRFEDLDEQYKPVDYSGDPGQDLQMLRHGASFQVEVSSGVYWVPAVTLGTSRYSNADIHNMLPLAPEEKQERISTLYEALQLYQVGGFYPSDDNVRLFEGGVNWEHHKPGYHAVRTNTGCCATDSNWLRYILDGDYEEVGYIATSQRDGSGHIFNYILQDGWYYIIDLTHYRANEGPIVTAVEDGDLNSYYATDFVLGNIHKVRDIQDYVDYVQETFGDPPGLMFMYTAENCLAVDGAQGQDGVRIIYQEAPDVDIRVIFDDPRDSLTFERSPAPTTLPDWNVLP